MYNVYLYIQLRSFDSNTTQTNRLHFPFQFVLNLIRLILAKDCPFINLNVVSFPSSILLISLSLSLALCCRFCQIFEQYTIYNKYKIYNLKPDTHITIFYIWMPNSLVYSYNLFSHRLLCYFIVFDVRSFFDIHYLTFLILSK